MTYLDKIRQTKPLIICITNDVVKNFTANGLLALGASPAMSEWPEDLEDLLPVAGALLINIGTLTDDNWQLYKAALDIAEKHGIPAVLDPVAVSAGPYRQKVVKDLLENHKLALIRGNAGEIAALIGQSVASKGVDSATVDDIAGLAKRANDSLGLPIVATGATDAIAVSGQVRTLSNGSSLMPLVTGTGCLLGAVLAAFLSVSEPDRLMDALTEGLSLYNIAGELAEQVCDHPGPGQFQSAFLDALYQIQDDTILQRQKIDSPL